MLQGIPVFRRRQPGFPLIDFHEVMAVVVSQLLGDLLDGKGGLG